MITVETIKALDYLEMQWSRLIRTLDDGRIELDSNHCENAIRPFVLGRKTWLFADTPVGDSASARLYSLIETAKANELKGTLKNRVWLEPRKSDSSNSL